MFDISHPSKIKNEKIMRGRVELSCFNYSIARKAGNLNVVPDTLPRCCATDLVDLGRLHNDVCHSGITRFKFLIRTHNLPFSVDNVKSVINCCRVCSECKLRFHRPTKAHHLIKSTQPFERLNIDFKCPIESENQNTFFLNFIDEYSRFHFVFPCKDTSAKTVISWLYQSFSLFGTLRQYTRTEDQL